jgi:hypothetical protein
MAGDDFFKTRMGQRFYEATMPKIADQLERLNTNIEALVAELRSFRLPSQGTGYGVYFSGVCRGATRVGQRWEPTRAS